MADQRQSQKRASSSPRLATGDAPTIDGERELCPRRETWTVLVLTV
jgi:hypothetical protein